MGIEDIEMMWDDVGKLKTEAERVVVIACTALTGHVLSGTDSWGSAQHMLNVGTRVDPYTQHCGL